MAQLTSASPGHGLELQFPYPRAELGGEIRRSAEDFRVIERLGFSPSGQGEHLYLYVRKTGLTTTRLIERLCATVGIPAKRAGYSGLKDKQAVTEQWISLHLPGYKGLPRFEDSGDVQVLEAAWHDRKLRVGAHRSNRFEIRVSNLQGSGEGLAHCVEQIRQRGFANYFGEQRFGAKQDNVAQALNYLGNARKRKRLSRTRRSLYLSALRSHLFNVILAHRITRGIWDAPVSGDLFMLAGSRSIFNEPLSEETARRYTELDIHCAISLWGEGDSRLEASALALEDEVFGDHESLLSVLKAERLRRDYRANRALAHDLEVELDSTRAELMLRVELERGVFVTSLLGQLLTLKQTADDMRKGISEEGGKQ